MTTADELERLRAQRELVWENRPYGAVYAVDRGRVAEMLGAGLVPVLHAGQAEAVEAIAAPFPGAGCLLGSLRQLISELAWCSILML